MSAHDKVVDRRTYLTALSTTGAIGLAGCTSGGSGTTELTMVTSQEDTSAFAMSQAVASVVNVESDELSLQALPAGGGAQGMAQMDQGDADIAYTNALNGARIYNEEGGYNDNAFEHEIQQLFKYYDVQYGWITSESFWDDGLQTVSDLGGHPVSPKGAGTASRDVIFSHLEYAMDPDDLGDMLSLSGSEDASALKEGRAHAVNDIRLNIDVAPGYIEELYSIVDGVHQLGWPTDAVEEIKADDRLQGVELGTDNLDPAPETDDGVAWWPTAKYVVFTNDQLSDEHAEEFVSVLYENTDTLAENHALTGYWSEASFFTDVSEAIPVHPGSQSYFEEIGE